MAGIPLLLFFAATSGCEDSLNPALTARWQNNAAAAISLLESVGVRCTGSNAFYDLLGVANELSDITYAIAKQSPALIGRARVYLSEGKIANAQASLREALSADAENPAAKGELGMPEAQQGQWTPAFQHLSRAWSQDRSNANIALQLGHVSQHLNRADQAVHLLTSLPASVQSSSALHLELAQLYRQLHKATDAQVGREALQRVEAQNGEAIHFDNRKTYAY